MVPYSSAGISPSKQGIPCVSPRPQARLDERQALLPSDPEPSVRTSPAGSLISRPQSRTGSKKTLPSSLLSRLPTQLHHRRMIPESSRGWSFASPLMSGLK